uniref:Uncharacterized protein n=1 Tax=Arundo donax TaxID=35708 RepID=A0A0A9AQ63_ARUDO
MLHSSICTHRRPRNHFRGTSSMQHNLSQHPPGGKTCSYST